MTRPALIAEDVRSLEIRTVRRCGSSVSTIVKPAAFAAAYLAAKRAAHKSERVEVIAQIVPAFHL